MKYTLPKIAIACTLLATISLQSCDKVKDAVKTPDITFTGANTDFVIPKTDDTTSEQAIGSGSYKYNIDSMIKAQSGGVVSYSSIKSVKITKVVLTLNDGDDNNNFQNFKTAGAQFNTDAKPGLSLYQFAYIENNPDTKSMTLELPIIDKDKNLKDYFSSGSSVNFIYMAVGKLRHATTKELHCHIDVTYNIGF